MKQLFGNYVTAKQEQNVLDYDDLLLAWAQTMEDPSFASHIGANWDVRKILSEKIDSIYV